MKYKYYLTIITGSNMGSFSIEVEAEGFLMCEGAYVFVSKVGEKYSMEDDICRYPINLTIITKIEKLIN